MGSATESISLPVLSEVVAGPVATFIEMEGNACSADGWRPLKTMLREIPLLVAFLPGETSANGTFGAAAPQAIVITES